MRHMSVKRQAKSPTLQVIGNFVWSECDGLYVLNAQTDGQNRLTDKRTDTPTIHGYRDEKTNLRKKTEKARFEL